MATLLAPSGQAALSTAAGAHNYRIIGVEITVAPGVDQAKTLVKLDGGSNQDTLAEQPHHIVLDRVYIHGNDTVDLQRGVNLNSAYTAIIDSNISDVHSKSADSQAIMGWNGTGPYLIQNNYLEAAGENVMFGGGDPKIPNALPRDIEILDNDFYKPLDWKGEWLVKNLLELKIGQRVLVEGNTFENNWADGQDGFAINLKSVNQDGAAPWSQTSDVTLRENVIRNSPQGIKIASRPEQYSAVPAARFVISNNLLENIGRRDAEGRLFGLLSSNADAPLKDVILEGNTALHNGVKRALKIYRQ